MEILLLLKAIISYIFSFSTWEMLIIQNSRFLPNLISNFMKVVKDWLQCKNVEILLKDGINSLFKWNKLMNLNPFLVLIVCPTVCIIQDDEFECFQ